MEDMMDGGVTAREEGDESLDKKKPRATSEKRSHRKPLEDPRRKRDSIESSSKLKCNEPEETVAKNLSINEEEEILIDPLPKDQPENSTTKAHDVEEPLEPSAPTLQSFTIVSNDPAQPIQANTHGDDEVGGDEAQDKEEPKGTYGMLRGCVRDRHLQHGVLYFVNMVFLFAWLIQTARYNATDCDSWGRDDICSSLLGSSPGLAFFFWIMMFGFFLAEFFCSSTRKYLKNLDKTEDIMAYMQRLYETKPTLSIHIDCYHLETRLVTYTDSNGNVCTRTETYTVVTYTEIEPVVIVSWQDQSSPVARSDIEHYQITKVKLCKTFTGDENYDRRRQSLIARNCHRDVSYNCFTKYDIDGYKTNKMSYVDLDKKPEYLTYSHCVLAHLTLFLSLPYRVWMSSISGKIHTTVHKTVQTQ